ncbi:hypothetical protein ACFQXA_38855 [Nocardiopsis composta]
MTADPTAVLLTIAALTAGHHAGDYWLQSDHQAVTKGRCDHAGRRACAGHVASLTLAQLVLLALVAVVTGTGLDPVAAALGLGVNAASHYWADRRATLRGLVLATERFTHKLRFHDEFGGAAHMDQAWHIAWIVPAALIAASPPRSPSSSPPPPPPSWPPPTSPPGGPAPARPPPPPPDPGRCLCRPARPGRRGTADPRTATERRPMADTCKTCGGTGYMSSGLPCRPCQASRPSPPCRPCSEGRPYGDGLHTCRL